MKDNAARTVYTIGHSTRSILEFADMLRSFNIEVLVDIRSFPGSRKYPHFDQEVLERHMTDAGMKYVHLRDLGGRRKPNKDSANTAWRNAAFQGYADYMETDEFKLAIKELEELASHQTVAYMCSEAVWWRCHRALVSDYLKVNGWKVLHIMDKDKATEHPYTKPAKQAQGKLFYD